MRGGTWPINGNPIQCRPNCACRWCATGEAPSRCRATRSTRAGRASGFRLRPASGKSCTPRLAEGPASFVLLHNLLLLPPASTTKTLGERTLVGDAHHSPIYCFTLSPFFHCETGNAKLGCQAHLWIGLAHSFLLGNNLFPNGPNIPSTSCREKKMNKDCQETLVATFPLFLFSFTIQFTLYCNNNVYTLLNNVVIQFKL